MHPLLKDILDNPGRWSYDNPITELLYNYYDHICFDSQSEEDPSYLIPACFSIPVEARESGIAEAVRFLLKKGYPLSRASDGWFPLMPPVGNLDAHMVRYLLLLGADCSKWTGDDETVEPWDSNWYLDEIDIFIMDANLNDPNKNNADFEIAVLETAKALFLCGGLKPPYYGQCLSVYEDRTIACRSRLMRF